MTDTKRSDSGAGWGIVIFVFLVFGVWGFRVYRDDATARTAQKQAQKASQVAAQRKDAGEQYVIGYDYLTGSNGYPKDYAQAVIHLRKAADEGDNRGYTYLGNLYSDGYGVPQDYAEAYFWYDLTAAKVGDPDNFINAVRDNVGSHLTKTVLLATQERARKWLEAHPAN